MGRIDLSSLDGIRSPSQDEIQKITRYYEHLYGNNARSSKVQVIISTVLGVSFTIYGCTASTASSLVIGAVALLFAFGTIKAEKDAKSKLDVFRSGDFTVIPGNVCEIMTDTTGMLGVNDVKFMSRGGRKLDARFRARLTQLQVGTPLLLIHVDEQHIRHGLTRVFTPFMLTEEGLRGTLF